MKVELDAAEFGRVLDLLEKVVSIAGQERKELAEKEDERRGEMARVLRQGIGELAPLLLQKPAVDVAPKLADPLVEMQKFKDSIDMAKRIMAAQEQRDGKKKAVKRPTRRDARGKRR